MPNYRYQPNLSTLPTHFTNCRSWDERGLVHAPMLNSQKLLNSGDFNWGNVLQDHCRSTIAPAPNKITVYPNDIVLLLLFIFSSVGAGSCFKHFHLRTFCARISPRVHNSSRKKRVVACSNFNYLNASVNRTPDLCHHAHFPVATWH